MKKGILALIGGAATALPLVLGAGSASAYANGTEIDYHDNLAYSACVTGTNQNGYGYICQNGTGHWVSTPNPDNYDNGWWWIGQITIDWYNYNGSYIRTTTCNTNSTAQWVTCYGP